MSILPMTTFHSLPTERTILKLCRAKQPKPKQLPSSKSIFSRCNPKQSRESDCIWLSWCGCVCVEGSPTLQEKLVGKEQLLIHYSMRWKYWDINEFWAFLSHFNTIPSLHLHPDNWENLKGFCHSTAGTRTSSGPTNRGESVPTKRNQKLIYTT